MGMNAAHCQGISECLESGHPVMILFSIDLARSDFKTMLCGLWLNKFIQHCFIGFSL